MTEQPESEHISVVIVDDHDMVASGLQALIEDDPRVRVVGRGNSVETGVAVTREHQPQVVLMDYRLPDGLDVQKSLKPMARLTTPRSFWSVCEMGKRSKKYSA